MRIVLMFLLVGFATDAFAGRGDDMTQAQWQETCVVKKKRLKKKHFSKKSNWKRYQAFCKKHRDSLSKKEKKKAKKTARKERKADKKDLKQTCKQPAEKIAKADHPRCCVHLFKKYRRNQTLKDLAMSAVSVTTSVATAGAGTAVAVGATAAQAGAGSAANLIKGPVAKKMNALKCEEHVRDFKEFRKLSKKLAQKNRLERKKERREKKGKDTKKVDRKIEKKTFEIRCMGLEEGNREIAPGEKTACCKMLKRKRTGQTLAEIGKAVGQAAAEMGLSAFGKSLLKNGLKETLKSLDPNKYLTQHPIAPPGTMQLNAENADGFRKFMKGVIGSDTKVAKAEWVRWSSEFDRINGRGFGMRFMKKELARLGKAAKKLHAKAVKAAGGGAAGSALLRKLAKKGGKFNAQEAGTDVNIVKSRQRELQCKAKKGK